MIWINYPYTQRVSLTDGLISYFWSKDFWRGAGSGNLSGVIRKSQNFFLIAVQILR